MKDRLFIVLAVAALLVTLVLLALALTGGDGIGVPGVMLGGEPAAEEPAEPSTPQAVAPSAGQPAAGTPDFASDLAATLTDEQRSEFEALAAEHADPAQFEVARGACGGCHTGAPPYDDGADLAVVLASMPESHLRELGSEQAAEVFAYFAALQP